MDHKQALSQIPEARRSALQQRSDAKGLLHLAGYLGALTVSSVWIVTQAPFWGLALVPQGVLLVFLFTLSHECTHSTPFRSGWLNEVVGHAIAVPLILPFIWFRYFHLAHHRHTNDPHHDPELEHGPRPETAGQMILYLSGWGYWRGMIATLMTNAFGTISAPYLPPRRHPAMRREARALLAVYALAFASLAVSPVMFWLWIVPVLIGQPFLRLYLLAEHGRCPEVANMLANSRTTFTRRAVRWLAWNMPYHAEHHSFPNVPFHQLPALHRDLAPHLQSTSQGYGRFARDYVTNLRAD